MGVYFREGGVHPTFDIFIGEENGDTLNGSLYKMFCFRAKRDEAVLELRSILGLPKKEIEPGRYQRLPSRYPETKIDVFSLSGHEGGHIYFVQSYYDDYPVKSSRFVQLSNHDIEQIPVTLRDQLLTEAKGTLQESESNMIIDFLLRKMVDNVTRDMSLSMLDSL